MPTATDVLHRLVLEDGRRWGDAATDWQQQDAAAVLAGDPPYHFQTRPRGGSKTSDQAGVSLALLVTDAPAASHSYCFAADKDQAGLLLDALRGFIQRTPGLADLVKVDRFKAINRRNGADLTVMPADGPGTYGLRPWMLTVDEFAQWPETTNHRQVWEAVYTSLGKVPGARLVILTTAGSPDHYAAKVLEHARSSAKWRTSEVEGPLPWADPDFLADQEALLLPSQYARLHLNHWTAADDRLTTPERLRQLVGHQGQLPPVDGLRYVMALDIGLVKDRTVAAIGHAERRPNGNALVVDHMQVWQGSKANAVSLDQVEAWIVRHSQLYNGAPVLFDPHQAAQLTQRLRARGIRTQQVNFTAQSVGELAVALHGLISSGQLALPDDPALIDELARVRVRESSPGVYRLDHAAGDHDDRAITLAMLAHSLSQAPLRHVAETARPRRPRPLGFDYVTGRPIYRTHRQAYEAWMQD